MVTQLRPERGPVLLPTPRIDGSSKREIVREVLAKKQPVIFENLIADWPAVAKWSPSWFREHHGDLDISVFDFTKIYAIPSTMRRFVDWLEGARDGELGKFDELYLSWNFEVLEGCPGVLDDFDFDSLFPRGLGLVWKAFWMGGAGAHTPVHYDLDAPNLHACISGRKRFVLFGPDQDPFLYPTNIYEWTTCFSAVDFRHPDVARHPLVTSAVGHEAWLGPGDVLFIPGRWWHGAWCETPCVSLNGWWYDPRVLVAPRVLKEVVKATLHKLGLYARNRCTCCGDGDLRRILGWSER